MEVRNFELEVIAASQQQPVVVDFWASWCQPCLILGPVLEKLEQQAAGAWRLAKIDTDANPELAAQWGIRGIPAVKMFHHGEMVAEFTGALPEIQVRRWLDTHLPSASKMKLQQAQEALARGEQKQAQKLLQQAVQEDRKNLEARVLLAEMIFWDKPAVAIADLAEVMEDSPWYDRVQALRTLERLLQMDGAALANTPGGSEYWQGILALRRRDFAAAFATWIEVMLSNRQLDDDGARRACVALFTLLGKDHPIAEEYRRKFSSALY